MLAVSQPKEHAEFNFDLDRMKNIVSGKFSKTVVTLEGKMSPKAILKVLMDVKLDKVQDIS